ncbi:MAG: endonuclease domain-containing protein [Proteobacteria bacterium]|nr:endonuclease domain-containing protein [Pseudomonadota bacterium]
MTKIFNRSSEKKKRRSLRFGMPKSEILLWDKIRGRQIKGFKFRRQYSVGRYVVDFYCPKTKLAIEVDGDSHFQEGAEDYDKERQRYIESCGIRFLRFTNLDVQENMDGVLDVIYRNLA